MSGLLRRPPARFVIFDRMEGPSGLARVGGLTNAVKSYGGAQRGIQSPDTPAFEYRWQDRIQVNPAHEQPKLIYSSGAQPLWRTTHLRRIVRTFMSAGPRFTGRWFYVGQVLNAYTARGRMTGVTTRRGTTYRYPRYRVAPRTIQLGGSPSGD